MATSSSTPGDLTLEWSAGDQVVFPVTFDDGTNPIDLTGLTFYAEVRNRQSNTTGFAFTIVVTDAVNGELTMTTPTDPLLPNEGIWDLRQKTGAGAVTTLLSGKAIIDHTVSDTV